MLHGECLPSHLVQVMVETIYYGDVAIPIQISEVGIVLQALIENFHHLAKTSREDNTIH